MSTGSWRSRRDEEKTAFHVVLQSVRTLARNLPRIEAHDLVAILASRLNARRQGRSFSVHGTGMAACDKRLVTASTATGNGARVAMSFSYCSIELGARVATGAVAITQTDFVEVADVGEEIARCRSARRRRHSGISTGALDLCHTVASSDLPEV